MPLEPHPSARPHPSGGGNPLLKVALLALALLTPAPVNAETVHDRVEQLHREGRAARDRGDRQRSLELLSEAWALRKTHDGAASLAQVEYELGMMRLAATHLHYACEHLPASADPARVARLFEALATIKKHLVTLKLRVEPKTAEVLLNGASLGVALEIPTEVFADPGAISITARLEGHTSWSTNLKVRAGETESFDIRLDKLPAEPPAPRTSNSSPALPRPSARVEPADRRDDSVPLILAAALSGITLATGAALWIVADAKDEEAERRLARLPGENRCGKGTPFSAPCRDIRERLESAKVFRTAAYGAFATSAIGVAVSYFVWPRSDSSGVSFHPSLSPSAFGTYAEGYF
jgi:hypothetical protein